MSPACANSCCMAACLFSSTLFRECTITCLPIGPATCLARLCSFAQAHELMPASSGEHTDTDLPMLVARAYDSYPCWGIPSQDMAFWERQCPKWVSSAALALPLAMLCAKHVLVGDLLLWLRRHERFPWAPSLVLEHICGLLFSQSPVDPRLRQDLDPDLCKLAACLFFSFV